MSRHSRTGASLFTFLPPSVRVLCLFFLFAGVQPVNSQIITAEWRIWKLPSSVERKNIRPRYIASNQFGDIYLLDQENYLLILIPGDGGEPKIAGGWGDSGDLFSLPSDVVAAPGLDVLVCDNATHRILRFDRKLNFVADIALSTFNPEPSEYPYRIARNHLGEIIVVSSVDGSIRLFSNDRHSITRIGDASYGSDRFAEIEDISVGDNGELGLVDLGSKTFLILSRAGKIRRRVPLPRGEFGVVQRWRNRWLVVSRRGNLYVYSDEERSMVEILQAVPFKTELFVTDCTVLKDSVFLVDDLSGNILTSELVSLE